MTPCHSPNLESPADRVGACENCGERAYLNSEDLCVECSEPERFGTCDECGERGLLSAVGLCVECEMLDLKRDMAALDDWRPSLTPKADLTIYYPRGYGLSQCEIAAPWPLVRATTIWSRWMPVLHPDAETQWSLEIIYP